MPAHCNVHHHRSGSRYLLTVFRYILMNPVKAGLCQKAEEYPHSSAREYLLGVKGITDTEWIGEIIEEAKKAKEE